MIHVALPNVGIFLFVEQFADTPNFLEKLELSKIIWGIDTESRQIAGSFSKKIVPMRNRTNMSTFFLGQFRSC